MSKCDECKMTRLCDELERINKVPKHENCRCFTPTKPQTNADRIRAMTDEELAEFIGDDAMHDICPNNCHDDLDRPCKVCALEWLKQEVFDG